MSDFRLSQPDDLGPGFWRTYHVCGIDDRKLFFCYPIFKQKFYLSRKYVGQILHFGKWIFISSIVYFLSMYIDRLYLAKVVPLELLGIYGIARSISFRPGG